MFGWGEKWSDLWRGENEIEIGWDVSSERICLAQPLFFLGEFAGATLGASRVDLGNGCAGI